MTRWSDQARLTISRVHVSLPADMPFAERKKAIDAAYPFGERTCWPYKAWLKARKAYLRPYDPATPAPLFAKHESPMERAKRLTEERVRGPRP